MFPKTQKYAVLYRKFFSNGAHRAAYYLTRATNEQQAIANCLKQHPTATIISIETFILPIPVAKAFYLGYKEPKTA